MNNPNSPGFESFQNQYLPQPPEQQELNELYGETYQKIKDSMGEAAADAYLQENANIPFGPTGEMTNPLPEERDIPYYPSGFKQQAATTPRPDQQVNIAPVFRLDDYRDRLPAPIDTIPYPQGPEVAASSRHRAMRALGKIVARLGRGA